MDNCLTYFDNWDETITTIKEVKNLLNLVALIYLNVYYIIFSKILPQKFAIES